MRRFVGLGRHASWKILPIGGHNTFGSFSTYSISEVKKKSEFERLMSSLEKESKVSKKPKKKALPEDDNTTLKSPLKSSALSKSVSEKKKPLETESMKELESVPEPIKKKNVERTITKTVTPKLAEETSTFKIVEKKSSGKDRNNTNNMSIAEYTQTKLQDKKFASKLQQVVNTEDDEAKIVQWGLKHDVRYNLENILIPQTDTSPSEIEQRKKKLEDLKNKYEEYAKKVSDEEEESRGEGDNFSYLREEESELPKKNVPRNFEVVESKILSSKPHAKTNMQQLVEKMKQKQPVRDEQSQEALIKEQLSSPSSTNQSAENQRVSTTILQMTEQQYNEAIESPEKFNKGWENKGFTPVIQNNFGRHMLILYPLGIKPPGAKVVEKTVAKKKVEKVAPKDGSRIPLRDLLTDDSNVEDVEENQPFDARDLEEKLIDAKKYFKDHGYDISDLSSILKEERVKQKRQKEERQQLEKKQEEKKQNPPILNERVTYLSDIQKEIEQGQTDISSAKLLDEYLGDDDPNQVFKTKEDKDLLLTEYETQAENAMFSEDLLSYLNRTPKENEDKLRRELANMSIGSIRLPEPLVDGVSEIVSEYPKNLIQRTAQILSAAFRLRTGGFDRTTRVFSRVDEEKKLNKEQNEQDELFNEQMEVLKKLRSYKQVSKKKKRPMDIEAMKKDSEYELNRSYNPQIIYKELESAAYIAHRLPAIYGTSYRIFSESVMRMPDFEPKTMLDFGTGPGTTIWAANEAFDGSIKEIMAVEPSTAMMDVATRLFEYMPNRPQITWRRFLNESSTKKYDLVVASFVLNELSNAQERERIVKALWKATAGLLVIVEPGTPIGFDFIREARATLLTQKFDSLNDKPTILAPCPHDTTCPMSGTPKWCHFAQRVERESFQKLTKGVKKQYENENFSFIAVKRQGLNGFEFGAEVEKAEEEAMRKRQIEQQLPDSVVVREISLRRELRNYSREFSQQSFRWPRIIDTPLKRGGHVITSMCLPEGTLAKVVIAKSDGRQGYKYLRKTLKGDMYPYPLTPKNLKKSTEMDKYFTEEE